MASSAVICDIAISDIYPLASTPMWTGECTVC